MPTKFTFSLVEEVARKTGLSLGRAKKYIHRGLVMANGAIVKDPEARFGDGDLIRVSQDVPVVRKKRA